MSKIFILIVIGLLLTGCGGEEFVPKAATNPVSSPILSTTILAVTPEPPRAYTVAPHDPAKELIQRRWLQGIPCKAPCWEGITPGKTTVEEALTILRNNTLISNIKVSTDSLIQLKGRITWKWNYNSPVGGSIGGASFDPKAPQQIIRGISPGYNSFLFRDIITAYGEPSHIWASLRTAPDIGDNRIDYLLRIIYLNQGFVLYSGSFNRPTLSLNLSLSGLEFFEPTHTGYFAATDSKSLPLAWEGFKGFDFYCRYETKVSSDCKQVAGY